MDATPHMHTPKIVRLYPFSEQGEYQLKYGDTTMRLCSEWREPTARDIRRVLPKVIKKHDKGSIESLKKAQKRQVAAAELELANSLLRKLGENGKWGTEVLAEIKKS